MANPWEVNDPVVGAVENLGAPNVPLRQTAKPWEENDPVIPRLTDRQNLGSAESNEYYERQFREMSYPRRAAAGAQNIINTMPIVRNIPGIETAISPSWDVKALQEARPIASGLQKTVGHTAPYAIMPQRALSTFPRAAFVGGTVEGTDAAMRGENVPLNASIGAVSTVPGSVVGKLLSPRSPEQAFSSRWNRAIDVAHDINRAQLERNEAVLRAIAGVGQNLNIDDFARPMLARLAAEHNRIPFRIPNNPSLGITNYPTLENVSLGALLGNWAGNWTDPQHVITGAVAGYALPRVASWAGNRAISGANKLLTTPIGKRVGEFGFGYLNNQLLSPQNRAALNALLTGVSNEFIDPSITATGR